MPFGLVGARPLAGLLALVLLGVSLVVVMIPWVKPDPLGVLGFLIFIALLIIGRRFIWRKPRWGVWVLAAIALLSLPFVVIAQGFGSVDMMALLFHMEFGVEGGGFEELHNEILTATLALLWVVFASYVISTIMGRRVLPYVVVAAALIVSHPLVIYFAAAMGGRVTPSDLAERLVLAPGWSKEQPAADLVVLYLEGLDDVYFDPARYGDALAPVDALRSEALSFTAVRQVEATGWSMAGIVATHCGVPLLPNGFRARNNFHGLDDFLGAHRCLGDVMQDAGYNLEFLQGGELAFAGYGTFLRQHGFPAPIGLAHFRDNYPEDLIKQAHINWVIDDQLLFAEALERQKVLLELGEPYGLFIETITTHGDIVYASRECMEDGKAGQTRDVQRILECYAKQVANVVQALRAQQGSRPMKLVIVSDHLSHDPRFKEELPLEARANTLMLIEEGAPARTIAKEGSMIDVYPTLLDWLDLAPDGRATRAGLGVSLLSDAPTLVEEKGLKQVNDELYINPELGRAIWRESDWTRR